MTLRLSGEIRVPGDKSITHRALLLAASARGVSRLRGLLSGADCRSTAHVLRELGNEIPSLPSDGGEILVRGVGLQQWRAPAGELDCGNSGTTVRLLMGLLAGRPFRSTLTGDASLRSRPMRRITDPLERMGARARELGMADRLPIELQGGPLEGIEHRSPKASAQIKSAVLLAGLSGRVPVAVVEPVPSRDHTERMLRGLDVPVEAKRVTDGWRVALAAPPEVIPTSETSVPGDFSSAAFFLALSALADAGELWIRNVGVNPTRTGLLEVLERMGARVDRVNERVEGGEPVADLCCRPAGLASTTVSAGEVPAMIDELPIVAVLASRARGETRITGAAELRAKESDRITVMVDNLRAIGVEAEELTDGLVVLGTDRPLRGIVDPRDDHRIAMAFGILAALPGNDISVDDPAVVDVSFPGFWDTIRTVTGSHPLSGTA